MLVLSRGKNQVCKPLDSDRLTEVVFLSILKKVIDNGMGIFCSVLFYLNF